MNVPAELLYTKEHEWIRMEGQTAVIGITDYAQDKMGDVVFVELPAPGAHIDEAAPLANLESVKAVSEVFMPQSGTVEAVNTALEPAPESLNTDPYGSWIARVTFDAPLTQGTYLDAAAYAAFCAEE